MIEVDRHILRLEIRENLDQESKTGYAWIIDLCDKNGQVIGEAIGAAETLLAAMKEAAKEITFHIASQRIEKSLAKEDANA